jgi:gliding motility associated protien GldN
MKIIQIVAHRCLLSLIFCAVAIAAAYAQPDTEATPLTLDDITDRLVVRERAVLEFAPIREADILWEKRIWRVIDTREKMNLPFASPDANLYDILADAALAGDIQMYSTEDDRFSIPLAINDLQNLIARQDTVQIVDPETYETQTVVVTNDLDPEDIKRYRLKEIWWFDTRTSTMRHRILGIAPMVEVLDSEGNFKFERPLFWVHYPTARPLLARHKAFVSGDNTATTVTWEDLFEMRYFASYVTKESNLQDRRLQDYLSGVDLLLESQKIEDALFNREHDLWSW